MIFFCECMKRLAGSTDGPYCPRNWSTVREHVFTIGSTVGLMTKLFPALSCWFCDHPRNGLAYPMYHLSSGQVDDRPFTKTALGHSISTVAPRGLRAIPNAHEAFVFSYMMSYSPAFHAPPGMLRGTMSLYAGHSLPL